MNKIAIGLSWSGYLTVILNVFGGVAFVFFALYERAFPDLTGHLVSVSAASFIAVFGAVGLVSGGIAHACSTHETTEAQQRRVRRAVIIGAFAFVFGLAYVVYMLSAAS